MRALVPEELHHLHLALRGFHADLFVQHQKVVARGGFFAEDLGRSRGLGLHHGQHQHTSRQHRRTNSQRKIATLHLKILLKKSQTPVRFNGSITAVSALDTHDGRVEPGDFQFVFGLVGVVFAVKRSRANTKYRTPCLLPLRHLGLHTGQ